MQRRRDGLAQTPLLGRGRGSGVVRTDAKGQPCPETLGEYRDYCAAIKDDNAVISFFDRQIEKRGRDSKVLSPHELVMTCLNPMFQAPASMRPKLVGFEIEKLTTTQAMRKFLETAKTVLAALFAIAIFTLVTAVFLFGKGSKGGTICDDMPPVGPCLEIKAFEHMMRKP